MFPPFLVCPEKSFQLVAHLHEEAGDLALQETTAESISEKKWLNFPKEDWDISVLSVMLKTGLG